MGLCNICITAVTDIPFVTQREHQRSKYGFIEKLWRIDSMQNRQTLCQRAALFFQRTAVNGRFGTENREGNGITLQRFANTGCQQLQRAVSGGGKAQLTIFQSDQSLARHLLTEI